MANTQASDRGLNAPVEDLAKQHKVVGWSWAVLSDGQTTAGAGGLTNMRNGVEATTDTLFQVGSITKLWTATAVMRLVERGLVGLDEPVRRYITDLKLTDEQAAATMTIRNLLTHTSGIDGDNFDDHGRSDDCVERLVRSYEHIPHLHGVGEMFAYSNAGYVFAGRVIELVTGKTWDAAIKELVIDPLRLTHTVTLPEEAIMFRVAVGHFALGAGVDPIPAPVWSLNRSGGPAGSTLCTIPSELCGFLRVHFEDGVAADGTRLLEAGSVAEMQTPQFTEIPSGPGGGLRGLAWAMHDVGGLRVIGHGGLAMGGNGQVWVVPERKVAVAVLSNTASGGFAGKAARLLLQEACGLDLPEPEQSVPSEIPVDADADLSPYVGGFERYGVRVDVAAQDGALVVGAGGTSMMGILLGSSLPQGTRLLPAGDHRFVNEGRTQVVTFKVPGPDGRMRYLDLGGRVVRRVEAAS